MGRCEKWTIAYRRRVGTTTLPDDLETPFSPLPNSWRYWRADPFLVEQDGKTWLFAELYDRVRLKGVLACCQLTDTGSGKWKIILDEPFHLSYPFVFCHEGQWYMIPESFGAGKILLYKATAFPWAWERVTELQDMVAVDSTIIQHSSGRYLITIRVVDRVGELVIFKVDEASTLSAPRIVSDRGDENVRPAGHAFYRNGCLLRPAQDCSQGYGYALNFMQIQQLDDSHFSEDLLLKVRPEDICITGVSDAKGIHTYNLTDRYEVIDYKEYEFGSISKLAGVVKRMKKSFFKKKKDGSGPW